MGKYVGSLKNDKFIKYLFRMFTHELMHFDPVRLLVCIVKFYQLAYVINKLLGILQFI